MAITRQQWADWVRAPVTQAVIAHLQERNKSLIETLLNVEDDTLEGIGLQHLVYRNQINGIAEFLDLDDLSDNIVQEVPNED